VALATGPVPELVLALVAELAPEQVPVPGLELGPGLVLELGLVSHSQPLSNHLPVPLP